MKRRLMALVMLVCMMGSPAGAYAQSDYPQSEYYQIRSIGQLKGYLSECAHRLDRRICFSYPAAMDEVFENLSAVETILYNCGVMRLSWTRYRAQRRIEIKEIEYYPGFRAARAWSMERLDLLTREELLLLDRAQQLVFQAAEESRTPLELARWLHDELCRSVVYTRSPDGKSTCDSAIGALQEGRAECDGYADAFYLLCTLAGFKVGFQHGTTVESADGSMHLWNVLEWEGLWYHVDVTWDDIDDPQSPDIACYRYFNIGSDMFYDHFWDSELTLCPLSAYTDWNRFFYTCAQAGEQGFGLYCSSLEDAAQYIAGRRARGMSDAHVMVDGRYENGQLLNETIKNVPVYGRWTTWTKIMGPYTVYDVQFRDD